MTKSFGGSKLASNMAIAGMIAGIFFFPPVGMIIGPFLGAFIGELIEKRKTVHALKIALLYFIAFILRTGLMVFYSIVTFC